MRNQPSKAKAPPLRLMANWWPFAISKKYGPSFGERVEAPATPPGVSGSNVPEIGEAGDLARVALLDHDARRRPASVRSTVDVGAAT